MDIPLQQQIKIDKMKELIKGVKMNEVEAFDCKLVEIDDCNSNDEQADYYDEYDDSEERHYEEFAGTYAQEVAGYSDEDIYDIFDGNPEAYWNID